MEGSSNSIITMSWKPKLDGLGTTDFQDVVIGTEFGINFGTPVHKYPVKDFTRELMQVDLLETVHFAQQLLRHQSLLAFVVLNGPATSRQ